MKCTGTSWWTAVLFLACGGRGERADVQSLQHDDCVLRSKRCQEPEAKEQNDAGVVGDARAPGDAGVVSDERVPDGGADAASEDVDVPAGCELPPDPGPCRSALVAYYYDPALGECREFTYGGCQGNQNNFPSLVVCERACAPDAGSR